jgi:hypothetical protein
MAGALDLDGRFTSVVDIDALVAQREQAADDDASIRRADAPLLLKPAGEDQWHTLAGAADSA